MKKLKYSKFEHQPGPLGARVLLTVKFMDDDGDVYSWMPKWAEAEQLLLKAINTESFNKPESEWLPRLAKTVKDTAASANQQISSAYKVRGKFEEFQEGKLIIDQGSKGHVEVRPLFPVNTRFLEEWLDKQVEVLIVDEVGVLVADLQYPNVYPVYPDEEE